MIMPIIGNGVGPANAKLQMHYTLFVPLTQNNGHHQPSERLNWIEQELMKRADGLTRYYPGHGLWVPSTTTTVCRDEIVPFHIVTANGPETETWLVELAAEIARVFEQDEVFVFTQPVWLLAPAPLVSDGIVRGSVIFRS